MENEIIKVNRVEIITIILMEFYRFELYPFSFFFSFPFPPKDILKAYKGNLMMCMLVHEESLCISIPELKAQPRRPLCTMLVVGVPLG